MLDNIRSALAGKKTYLLAAGAIIGTLVAWSEGMISTLQAIQSIVAAIGTMTMRAAIAKTATKEDVR